MEAQKVQTAGAQAGDNKIWWELTEYATENETEVSGSLRLVSTLHRLIYGPTSGEL